MLQNLPSMLGIEPFMIKSNQQEQEIQIRSNKQPMFDYSTQLGVGQLWQSEQKEVQIVLDINRPLNDEYAAGMGGGLQQGLGLGLYNNLESNLKKYDIKKPDITKDNKFSMIAVEQLIKILNDQTLVDHHEFVLEGIRSIVQGIGKDSI